jgi:hypothetical protein
MVLDDLFADGEPQACSPAVIVNGLGAAELDKDVRHVFRSDAHSGVADAHQYPVSVREVQM